jgi:chromosomal replication initiator protein
MPRVDSSLWRDIVQYLHQRHPAICRQWFEELEPLSFEAGLLTVRAATPIQQNYLQRKCLDQFIEATQAVTGALVAVRFLASNNGSDPPQPHAAPLPAAGPAPTTPTPEPAPTPARPPATNHPADEPVQFDHAIISPDYRFDNFVTGPCNHMAYAASVAVSKQLGTAYNPLFIHGGVGLGKTHLLQAVCQSVIENNPHTHICYLSCEAFMNQFLDCVQRGQMNRFRDRYRNVDLLVIDDIHFLSNRERTQEEFFHTFNALYQAKKQIVLSSDSPPSEIPQLEERLVSRFGWGLVTPVCRPCYETRLAIVRAKAQLRNASLPDEVIEYIATRIQSNARELEGALTTIQGYASLQNKPIDLALAREALHDPASASSPPLVTLQHITDAVVDFYSIKRSDVYSKRRHKSIAGPRQVCMWLARKRTSCSLEEIGRFFGGRDHTTVLHSVKIIDQRLARDSNFALQLEELTHRISRF